MDVPEKGWPPALLLAAFKSPRDAFVACLVSTLITSFSDHGALERHVAGIFQVLVRLQIECGAQGQRGEQSRKQDDRYHHRDFRLPENAGACAHRGYDKPNLAA